MRFKQRVRALLLCTAALASLPVAAAVLDDLYQVRLVQEEGQSRDEAMREAATVMLQRLAGNKVDLQRPAIATALQTPQELMRRIGSAEGGQLRIEFEPDAVGRVLRDADQPALGRNRPGIVLWAVETGELGDRTLNPVAPWALRLKQAAQHRAVALSFPLGDLQDMALVSEEQIRQASQQELIEASERYPAEGTLALTIAGEDEQTTLSWTLWLNDQRDSGRISGTAEQAADELMRRLADAVFEQYAIPAGTAAGGELSGWQLQVEGIDSVAAYSGLLRMLRQLGTQQQPRLLAIDGDTVLLQVSFPGSEAQLERMLNLDMRLQRIPEPPPKPEPVVEPEPALDMTPTAPADDGFADIEGELAIDHLPAAAAGSADEPEAALPEQVQPVQPPAPALPTLYFRWRG